MRPPRCTVRRTPSRWLGRVELINGRVDPETRTFRARVGIDNRAGRLKAGGLARVVLEIASDTQAVVVPRRAVSFSNGQPSVFLYRPTATWIAAP
jgi:multidrug efflux pump subunit AcrA (membrane-fusion protein)